MLLIPGTQCITEGIYVFQCPVCAKRFRYDDPYEPTCTGPSEMRDDHPPTVMKIVREDTPRVWIPVR